MDTRILTTDGLQALVDALQTRGFHVLGPAVRDGAIGFGPVREVADLPAGWGDEQEAGHYRLRRRDDPLLFAYAAGAQSAKPLFFPAQEVLWRARHDANGVHPTPPDPEAGADGPVAVLGVRSCDLAAVGIQDEVLLGRRYGDAAYALRREGTFVVAVTCSHPAATCFCGSMGTGPRPGAGTAPAAPYDLAMTEVLDEHGHRFVVEVATERGGHVLDEAVRAGAAVPAAGPEDLAAADDVAARAAQAMGRQLDTSGLKELLYASAESPVWDEVATRCLACANCTQVCPTCFCTDVRDVTDLTGALVERDRVWDSCFGAEYSYIHGGSVRASTRARYRQWLTHKLASWEDQFGMSGCVGCGRCITWCPAAIDLTAEVAALRHDGGGRRDGP
ncbi:4Fe-4S dicluster domain-containing protein [Nocardioides sp. T2.26MG-1]|uniref:4Fe-4S dicluster domain-containing protein n=1 Tax=Nocardioides sp. T2.26MG-1 TaxID=3041166 RepID=UPI0024775F2F|nr:4Fe-4S dicluster domain-containing protein [Nocardioides sp. T2.26MG-1]CAI9404194.1 Anaerobic sulfite reductase subunit A [Nocardioides sp. T2.26MG-1]